MSELALHSERLVLRPVRLEELKVVHKLHSFPETDEFNALGIPADIDETLSVIKKWISGSKNSELTTFTFAIERSSDKQFIGLIALNLGSAKYRSAEVWYKLDPGYWGKGYATEALNLVLNYGFDTLKLHRIEAGCAVKNIGSIRVLEKVGMTREGGKRQALPLKSGWSDNYEYAMLESDSRSMN